MPAAPDAVEAAVAACEAAVSKKARDPAILEVADILTLVDLFVLASTTSDRHLDAVVDEIERALREEQGRKPLRREGTPASGWVLLDYGDVVCHVFSAEQRDFYSLERLWADVPRRDVETGEQLPSRHEETVPASTADASA